MIKPSAVAVLGLLVGCASSEAERMPLAPLTFIGPVAQASLSDRGILELEMKGNGAIYFTDLVLEGICAAGAPHGFSGQYYAFLPQGQAHRINLSGLVSGTWGREVRINVDPSSSVEFILNGCMVYGGTWPVRKDAHATRFQVKALVSALVVEGQPVDPQAPDG